MPAGQLAARLYTMVLDGLMWDEEAHKAAREALAWPEGRGSGTDIVEARRAASTLGLDVDDLARRSLALQAAAAASREKGD